MQFSIDRSSPVPAYYQIQLDLSDRIQRGEWNDRKQLPSESTLAEQYAVSRITLRQALAELEKMGKLSAVVTQNIDGLHQKAGSRKVIELHGSVLRNICQKCGRMYGMEEFMELCSPVPHCPGCGGVVKPDVVLYEEMLDRNTIEDAIDEISRADMLIIGGTSLVVYPAAGYVDYFQGDSLVMINRDETPRDSRCSLVFRESVGKVLEAGVAALKG